ncbi:MAG: bacillithiol biosynthesis BshC, partial [Gemmatimonadales bacterium]
YLEVQQGAVDIDPTLERLVGAAQGRAKADLDRVERKAEQHLRRREAVELAQIARARIAVRPDGAPQERVLGVAGFLARFGPRFLDDAFRQVGAWYERTLVSQSPPS